MPMEIVAMAARQSDAEGKSLDKLCTEM